MISRRGLPKIKVSLKDNAAETKTVLLDETENLDDPAIQTNLPVEGSVNNVLHFRYELKKDGKCVE